jgi:hypothetical protein
MDILELISAQGVAQCFFRLLLPRVDESSPVRAWKGQVGQK